MIFLIAFGLFVAFELFYLSSQKKTKDEKAQAQTASQAKPAPGTPAASGPMQEQKVENLYVVDTKNQVKVLDLWSPVAHKTMGSTVWRLEKVKAEIHSESVTYTVFGDSGTVDDVKKNMFIEGNVKMIASNGYQFLTDHLDYNPETKKIKTDDKVIMEGVKEGADNIYLEGVGLDVNLENNRMLLLDQVSGKKPMSGNRMMKISSKTAEMSGIKKSMIFRNDVVIRVDKMIVKGNYADFQYKDGKLDTLFMDGGIHLQDQDKIGSSGIAIVYFNEDKYVFKKKPFITQGENELIGDEITVFNGGKRVQVSNAKVEYHQEQNQPEKRK